MGRSKPVRWTRRWRGVFAAALAVGVLVPAGAMAQEGDPREGLDPGWQDAETAISNLELTGTFPKDQGLFGSADFANNHEYDSDLAFQGDRAFMGNYSGFQVFDVSNPSDPVVVTEVVCPGGQGDVTVFGDLLFRSVEGTNGRWDCGTEGNSGETTAETKMRGIQVWDISDIASPNQVTAVPLCRGSHTHSIVEDPNDASTVYIYNSGTSSVQSTNHVSCNDAGSGNADIEDPARWKTEIIAVPVDDPASAAVVNEARLFTDESGAVNGLIRQTDACHDITAYPAVGLAAGACEGNGILIDISDPANPSRLDAVADEENFAYWHSATFNNDGTKVVFTDEWGGGSGARCRATDPTVWGADAIFDIVDDGSGPSLEFASYYKLPAIQTSQENCVAHNGSLVPVPGRDIMIQAWYQGGMSMVDFTDSANPVEIAYFDRGPISPDSLVLGGYWSAYWYDGGIVGSEISRGLDTLKLAEGPMMSDNEIAVAEAVDMAETNVQGQDVLDWEATPTYVRALTDQANRGDLLTPSQNNKIELFASKAEDARGRGQSRSAIRVGQAAIRSVANDPALDLLEEGMTELVDSLEG